MDKVVHFEIPADNLARAGKFYEQAFGWKINSVPGMDYSILGTTEIDPQTQMPKEKGAINGGMMTRVPEIRNPVVTINVSDVETALKKITSVGGKIVRGKTKVGEMGFAAYFRDTEGNVLGLWENAKKG